MLSRALVLLFFWSVGSGLAFAQEASSPSASRKPASSGRSASGGGTRMLPNEHGQVWREYNIASYTKRVTNTEKPEQAVVDWILRETGKDAWFSEPVGLLSANRTTLRVYHTPEMQLLVSDVVDRMVHGETESHSYTLRLITVGSPNWRSRVFHMLRPVPVQSPGLEAWLLSKEDAAVFVAELRRRTDFHEHTAPNLLIHCGQSHTIASMRPKNYVRSVNFRSGYGAGYDLVMGQVEEGYSLQFSPLLSVDGRTLDAVIKCQVEQVEKLIPVSIDVPAAANQRQRVQIQVPQVSGWSLHERFRWPTDQVLLLSRGVVARPAPSTKTILGMPHLFGSKGGRGDALLMVQCGGAASQTLLTPAASAPAAARLNNGRY